MKYPKDDRLPSPTENEMLRALSTMGVMAGLPDTLVPKEGSGETRAPVGLPWVSGMAASYLQPLEEWWSTHATTSSSGKPFQAKVASASHHPIIPEGSSLDNAIGRFLADRQPLVFPSPLATPSTDKKRKFEKERLAASETFSCLHSMLGVVRLLDGLSKQSEPVSPSVICSHLLPLVAHSVRRMIPTMQAAVGSTIFAHLEMWRMAVKPLPACARNDILAVHPWAPSFGSVEAVNAAASRNPQLEVTIKGAGLDGAKGTATSKTVSSAVHQSSSKYRPSSSGQRYHPYHHSGSSQKGQSTSSEKNHDHPSPSR